MQIKMKPGKPTEPGNYMCRRYYASLPEYVRILECNGKLEYWAAGEALYLHDVEDDALFSERIELVIEE